MVNILVTNDDGIYSPGLALLYNAIRDLGNAIIMAPETPKSASGLGLTLHKPLRAKKMIVNNLELYAINGTPSDVVHVASHTLGKIDLVVSGINIGDNTSIQVILSSGTVGAAAQAAILGIPAIAFSASILDENELISNQELSAMILRVSKEITQYVIEHGLPKEVWLLNVNFPNKVHPRIRAKVVPAAKIRFAEYIDKRLDPRKQEYYWIYGEPIDPPKDTDVYVITVEKNIAITPLTFDLNAKITGTVENITERINDILRSEKITT
ncbi:MAG: 5'/3'-nucleotidase SurE [Thermoprotei archaeon]